MNAPLSDWRIGQTSLDPRQELLNDLIEGIEVSISEIDTGPGNLLSYKGEQVLLYIKDTGASKWTLENEPEKTKRYHVAECRTLDDMRRAGRFDRYVATIESNGEFKVDWCDPKTRQKGPTKAALKVCKNCLKSLDYRGFESGSGNLQKSNGMLESRTDIWSNFSISEFLRDYATFFVGKPRRRDEEAEVNQYVSNWAQLSQDCRRRANWTCSDCQVDLKENQRLLHAHHRSGVVTDNRPINLRALCAICHSEQPHHTHMKVTAKDQRSIIVARSDQGKVKRLKRRETV